jgi:hypothetical protein
MTRGVMKAQAAKLIDQKKIKIANWLSGLRLVRATIGDAEHCPTPARARLSWATSPRPPPGTSGVRTLGVRLAGNDFGLWRDIPQRYPRIFEDPQLRERRVRSVREGGGLHSYDANLV